MTDLGKQFGDIDIYLFDQLLRGRVGPGMRILDAGCGFGRNLIYDAFADFVISSAVLHFARDDGHFHDMLHGTWRVLKPGGVLFCRLASSIGLEHQLRLVAGRRFQLPDGSERYLVDEAMLTQAAEDLRGETIDPLKTTVVQNERSMTTWVLRKN